MYIVKTHFSKRSSLYTPSLNIKFEMPRVKDEMWWSIMDKVSALIRSLHCALKNVTLNFYSASLHPIRVLTMD